LGWPPGRLINLFGRAEAGRTSGSPPRSPPAPAPIRGDQAPRNVRSPRPGGASATVRRFIFSERWPQD
jgi:hypothetical protein